MYEVIQVISKIDSLNSLSTFHRWRKFAEELCNVEFQKRTIQVGKTSYTKISTTILSLKTKIGGLEVGKMARRAKRAISAY
ncbi:hypothetical protein A5844_000949 [Enterococcus sp. 10A9_DIV0425]|uniref:Uncharacterized protein n=1 Tax=Candidatus Enterococcus wittei TaxID=1987383 RepID=A0A242JZQ8_9ENTE|nr:hypothetical protein [Enterococcus sp. 10A9_DIV0425]OTP10815.1 hypothetical protein A5844_000949 [Enterococcus sp. 10A9_DIV0425]